MEFSIFDVSYRYLMKVTRHVQSTRKRKFVFEQYVKKKVLQLPLCSILMQNIQIIYWVPAMFVVTYFWVAVAKYGRDLLHHGTLKSAVSQESEMIK